MAFSRRENERERRARVKVAEEAAQKGKTVNWLSLGPQQEVLRLANTERKAEAEAAETNMQRIAARIAEFEERRRLLQSDPPDPLAAAALDDRTNKLVDDANNRRQKARPDGRKHPIIQKEIIPERRLERQLNPKSRKPPRENWRTRIDRSPAWQGALEWFRMTPEQQAAAEAAIATAVNAEPETLAKVLALQAEWDAIDPKTLEQMDLFGYIWPADDE